MHEIYISGLNYEHASMRVSAIRGVRMLLVRLGVEQSFRMAASIVDDFIETPTVMRKVAEHQNDEVVAQAVQDAIGAATGAISFAIDPEDLELPDPEPDDGETDAEYRERATKEQNSGPFTPPVYRTAMVLLASERGNPLMAYARAFQLAKASDDVAFYKEVQNALHEVFELVFDSGLPQIHIVGE